jgi:hypothetical protein
LATDAPTPQRVYRALCPHCGAPVEFRSAASVSAVCSYCRSTLLRDGDTLRRIGQSADLFDDHSPLRLGAGGRHQGVSFTLVGRLQHGYEGGTWNEWHALFDTGRTGWLSEDNGRYVFAFDVPLQGALPRADELVAGERRVVDGRTWSVASVTRAKLLAAEGELPRPPVLQGEFIVADLRNEADEVGTLDYGDPAAPLWSVGRSVALRELALSGLAVAPGDASEKTLGASGLQCPSCGAALLPKLDSTQSIVCTQCQAVVDISRGAGADLAHYAQHGKGDSGREPELPLGAVGTLTLGKAGPLPWQIVGWLERRDEEDEPSFWHEYLLYHRTEGFAFLVGADDGWSWVVPLTGAPTARGDRVNHGGVNYRERYQYTARTTHVLGEFYWRVSRDQRSRNVDYHGLGSDAHRRLNREDTGTEVTWSAGATITADAVAAAFGVKLARRRPAADVSPVGGGHALRNIVVLIVLLLLVVQVLTQCSRDDCDQLRDTFGASSNEYQQCLRSNRGSGSGFRTGGGSYGGFGGGGHK